MSAARGVCVLLLGLALALPAARGADALPKLPDDVFSFAQPPGDDAVDIALIGAGRAAIVRVHVRIGDKPLRSAWADFAVRLHAYLDTNGDGILTTAENGTPWEGLLASPLAGNPVNRSVTHAVAIDTEPCDGKVSVSELRRYLQETQGFLPFTARAGAPPDPRAEALFAHLDRDGDKIIATAELSATEALLARLDQDEDEILSLDELTPDRSPLADRFRNVVATGPALDPGKDVIPLTSHNARLAVAHQLLRSPGRGKPAGVAAGPLGADPAEFRTADRDRDGRLAEDELLCYLLAPTLALELSITLPARRSAQGRIARLPGRPDPALLAIRAGTSGTLITQLARSEFEFSAAETGANSVRTYDLFLRNFDTDKDGAIDGREAGRNVILQQMHAVADRNGDDKMTQREFDAYYELSNAAEDARTVLTVSDRGTSLLEQLDADHDGRLSLRELRRGRATVAGFDADHDGRIALSELPRRYQLNIGRGPMVIRNRLSVAAQAANADPRAGASRANGPRWFAGMDRNRDGDVSLREFLGAPETFRQFDADGDGLIDAVEAARH